MLAFLIGVLCVLTAIGTCGLFVWGVSMAAVVTVASLM